MSNQDSEAPNYTFSSSISSETENITANSFSLMQSHSNILPTNSNFNSQSAISCSYSPAGESPFLTSRQICDAQKNNVRPNFNRNQDNVYISTKNVVKAIITLSQVVGENKNHNYLELVKDIGFELRKLLQSVDHISPLIPAEAYK